FLIAVVPAVGYDEAAMSDRTAQSGRRPARGFWLLTALALVAGGAAFGWREFQVRRDRAEALGLAQRGHFSDSEPLLKGVLERTPNDLEVIQALARGYVAIDNRPEAETYLGRWCALEPDVARPYQARMEFWEGIEKWDRALADGQRVLELE